MIVLSETKTLDNYFIDENAVITDEKGNVQKQYLNRAGRPLFKGVTVHKIMMYTFHGYRDGKRWVIHHKDENKQNNSLTNLIYLTYIEHICLHHKGKHRSEETRAKMSATRKGHIVTTETRAKMSAAKKGYRGRIGKYHSEETRAKMRAAQKGLKFFNNGIKNVRAKQCPQGFNPGRIKTS